MRQGLSVVPHVGARSRATPGAIAAALPCPESPVHLTQHRRRLEDREIGGDGFDDLGWQRRIVEAVAEALGLVAQAAVALGPVPVHLADVLETAGVPGSVEALRSRLGSGLAGGNRAGGIGAKVAVRNVPGQKQAQGPLFLGLEGEREVEARRRRSAPPRSRRPPRASLLRAPSSRSSSAGRTSPPGTSGSSPWSPGRRARRRRLPPAPGPLGCPAATERSRPASRARCGPVRPAGA